MSDSEFPRLDHWLDVTQWILDSSRVTENGTHHQSVRQDVAKYIARCVRVYEEMQHHKNSEEINDILDATEPEDP